MAEWKKVVVSGSIAELNKLTITGSNGTLSASFISGDGTMITGIISSSHAVIADSATSTGTATSASHAVFADSAASATAATSASHAVFADTAGSATSATTATSASHAVFADTAGSASHALFTDGLAPGASGTDLTLSSNLNVGGNFVVAGTASFNHTDNLSVADKYILLNSGSTQAGNAGGIVIQGETQNVGELFGYVSSSSDSNITRRWGILSGFDAATSGDFTADAFMSAVIIDTTGATVPAATNANTKIGNIFSGNDGEIYIYAQ